MGTSFFVRAGLFVPAYLFSMLGQFHQATRISKMFKWWQIDAVFQ
jgi:hypothetical protein